MNGEKALKDLREKMSSRNQILKNKHSTLKAGVDS